MGRLLGELRARKLDRLAAAYAVAGWILVQGASILLPAFDAPVWVLRFFIVAVVLGFPVAMAAGWVLASSPAGAHAENGAEGQGKRSRRFVALLAIGIAAALLLTAAGYLLQRSNSSAQAPPDIVAVAPAPNSVAVLPFANMSGDPAKEYFSDGFAEELLIDLSKTPHLRVAARTSSFKFRGSGVETADVARKLHVRAVVEGSVRQAGNRVRISVQLVNAADGFNMWSASYDRDLTDILTVQDEIARAITIALTNKLLGSEIPHPAPRAAIDPEAYRLYLEAKYLAHRGNEDDLKKAVALLGRATALEPGYAEAFAELGGMLRTLVERYSETDLLVQAETATRQALSLDPTNVGALNNLTTLLVDRWQWKDALQTFQKAQAINPGSAGNLHQRSIVAYTFNFPAEDLAAELKATELDPLQAPMQYGVALWYWNNKQYDASAAAIQKVLTLRKGKFQDLDQQCAIEVGRGRLDEARRVAGQLSSYFAESPQNSMNCPFYLAVEQKDFALARKLTDAAAIDAEKNGGSFVTIGDAYRQIGDLKSAMPWYERAYEARDTLLLLVPYEGWQTPEPLVSYPAWKALWARAPIREWEAARIEAGKILGVAH